MGCTALLTSSVKEKLSFVSLDIFEPVVEVKSFKSEVIVVLELVVADETLDARGVLQRFYICIINSQLLFFCGLKNWYHTIII